MAVSNNRKFMQGIIPNKRNHRLSEEQKGGIRKMIEYFSRRRNQFKKFQVHIGVLIDGSPHLIWMEGLGIVKHLEGVLEFEVYGEEGREILNGMRECYYGDVVAMRI